MGIYLNPGNEMLRQDRNAEIFIDKSLVIAELNKHINSREKFFCVSRPRRFGKSMAGNMIAAYYSKGCDSRELFKDLKIAKTKDFETYLNKLNVIKIDLNAEYMSNKGEFLPVMQRKIMKDFFKAFPDIDFSDCRSFADCMLEVYADRAETFVIIIDEYDVLVREKVPRDLFVSYLEFLNAMFKNSTLSPAISLTYLTGILPIVRDQIQSKLNLFTEYSMTNPMKLAEFVGFTAEETKAYRSNCRKKIAVMLL